MVFSSLGETARVSCSQHSPSAVTQAPETLVQHTGIIGTRGCVWQWTPFPGSLGPQLPQSPYLPRRHWCSLFPAARTHCCHPWKPPRHVLSTCWKGLGGKTTILQPSSEQLPVIHGQGYTEWVPLKVCPHPPVHGDTHNMHQWFTQGIWGMNSLVQQEAAGQERGGAHWNGMGSQSESNKWPLQCAGRGCRRGKVQSVSQNGNN